MENNSTDLHYGYTWTQDDKTFLRTFKFQDDNDTLRVQRLVEFYASNELKDRMYINCFGKVDAPVLTILSAKYHRMVGYAFKNFISLAKNAIQ